MNSVMKSALTNSKSNYVHLKAALFHSTPVLERKRRNFWDSRSKSNHSSRRSRRMNAKRIFKRNANDYAEFLFESWKKDAEEDDPFSTRGTSWFKKQYHAKGSSWDRNGNQQESRYQYRREFWDDDFDIETVFRSAFGGNRFFYWSFMNEGNPQWRRSARYSYYEKSWNWRQRSDDEYDFSSESDNADSDLASHRLALGLSASGPLKHEDVKNAYRACALKWHPDRHQGSSKAMAEEKFKLCSAAYQSLCDKLRIS
ncbi:hypothetical protein L6164_034033 [Bauhinia variegata]|uniref:Uncharacterized protein n=1 Tax=Bauhinia variegata TaxID=167791 RepID=A0ACB9KTH8_BAUVA|nr:hypothetical protein L6164_034033 [Bauhinia variegata]